MSTWHGPDGARLGPRLVRDHQLPCSDKPMPQAYNPRSAPPKTATAPGPTTAAPSQPEPPTRRPVVGTPPAQFSPAFLQAEAAWGRALAKV